MLASVKNPPSVLLVASSDRSLIEAVQACLIPPQYRCVLAGDGNSALEQLRTRPYRVVLAEMRLLDMNGLEFLRRAAVLAPETAVILICSYRDWELALEAMRCGAADILTRPIRNDQMVACIAGVLERQRVASERKALHTVLEETLVERTEHLHQALVQLEQSHRSALETLVMALDSREPMTRLHSVRVQAYTELLAERCGYATAGLPELAWGALLHDIGKIVIPDSILFKKDALTADERRIMQQHTTRGYQILSQITHLKNSALVALCHHERMDGQGYPLGLQGEEIPIEARIFAVADAFDVILGGRHYCPARPMSEACAEIELGAGTQFDRDVVEAFLEVEEAEWLRVQDTVARRENLCDMPLPALQAVPIPSAC